MFLFVFGESKILFHQLALRPTWEKKSINAVADVQLKNVKFVALTFL